MTLDEARAELESRFQIGPHGSTSIGPTGEPYVTICSGGAKEEGQRLACVCSSEPDAIRLWVDAIRQYTAGKEGTLYWRIVPEIDSIAYLSENYNELPADIRDVVGKHTFWIVYSRLLISNKPALTAAA